MLAIWIIAIASIACVIARPRGIPEAVWAAGGAALLVLFRLIGPATAWRAIVQGADVYLFLTGMMILSELARHEGVFDWLAALAVRASRGSPSRLFVLVYAVGTVVTVLLSNDATAVVLTPAVQAAVKAAQTEPLPYLLICAFIANAASFVLPISNPANLVVYQGAMPPLLTWLRTFGLASVASIITTFLVLRWLTRRQVTGSIRQPASPRALTTAGKITLGSIALFAVVLLTASGWGHDLGLPAFLTGLLAIAAVMLRDRGAPLVVVRQVAWSVLPLVAGLFVIVEALNTAGAASLAAHALLALKSWPPVAAALASSFGIAALSNLMNNLPTGLIAGQAARATHISGTLRDALLIGVDLGPNLSVSGSLATILWLIALRRNGENVSFWRFLAYGAVITPPALLLATLLVR